MALNPNTYKAFEDIVGSRNISDDPAITENYRCVTAQSSAHYGPYDHRTPAPQAVIMPGSTEEVRQIIRLCNKYKIEFKAASTFWAAMGYIGSDNAVQLDMIRMDKLSIDAKNMVAVIEPFVPYGTIQVEAMKAGLNINVAGVGASASLLAGTSGHVGFGPSSIFMGTANENLLGAEWVLPNGDVLRTGTLGAEGEWYCGEGPGPSTRAILRGWLGTAGSMGVCTRIAVRLHPWPGPSLLPTRGTAPLYKAAEGLENIKTYTLCFPDWDAFAESFRLLYEADISYLAHRQFNLFGRDLKTAMLALLSDPKKQLCDLPALLDDPEIRAANEKMKIEYQVVMAGFTKRDLDYKERALDSILEQTGGWKSEWMQQKEIYDFTLLYLLRLGRKNYNFTFCGSFEGNFGLSSNVYVAAPLMEEATALKLKWERETDAFAACGGDSDIGSVSGIGGGGTTGWEFFTHFDAFSKDSIKGVKEFFDATQEWMFEKGLGPDMGRWNVDARREDGYHYTQDEHDAMFAGLPQPSVAEYQWKIREAFNPNNLTGSYYRTKTPGG